MESVWQKKLKKDGYPSLKKDIEREIVVIGGGIAGILAAYQLSQRGYNVTLVEADRLMQGTTVNTTANINALQGVLYSSLAEKYSLDFAKKYYTAQQIAVDEYEILVKRYNIDCSFRRVPSYVFSRKKDLTEIKKEYETLKNMGVDVKWYESLPDLPLEITGAYGVQNQAQFNVTEFLEAIPKDFEIYENTRVTDIDMKRNIIITDFGNIKAEKIIIATKFPIVNVFGLYFLKMYQSHDYAVAFKGAKNVNGSYTEDKEDGYCCRGYKDYLILDGLDHRSGRINSETKFQDIEKQAKELFNGAEAVYKWNANDCVTMDGIPYIGRFCKKFRNIYIISGFNKWGMANAMYGGILISDLLSDKNNEYSEIFSPLRKRNVIFFGGIFKNAMGAVANLSKAFFRIPFKTSAGLEKCCGDIVWHKGRRCAVYKDNDGIIYAINNKCPHLKCELAFNKNTITWDCPCHGSRFDIYGNIISGPADEKPFK